MNPPKVALVVEGHGEVQAAPLLLRRIAGEIDATLELEVLRPIRQPRSKLLKPGELERAVQLAALKARPSGGVIVLLDSDDDCPAELGPALLTRALSSSLGLPVSVILAKREFEAWFLAAAESLRGKRGLDPGLAPPPDPEEIRGAKEWLNRRKHGPTYSPTVDQPALATIMDLTQAPTAASFERCCREVGTLLQRLQEGSRE